MAMERIIYELNRAPRFLVMAYMDEAMLDFSLDSLGSNSPRQGEPDLNITALSGTTRRGYGIHMRGVLVGWTESPPVGYTSGVRQFIPIPRSFRFASIRIGMLGDYRGSRVQVLSKIPETIGA